MTVLKSRAIEPVFLQHRNSYIPGVYTFTAGCSYLLHINVPAYALDVLQLYTHVLWPLKFVML